MLYIDDVFNFLIDSFSSMVKWLFTLDLHISENMTISFGEFLICVVGISIMIKFIINTLGIDNIWNIGGDDMIKHDIDKYNDEVRERFWNDQVK